MNKVVFEDLLPSGQTLQIVQGDLTEERVDAIVNAANRRMQHGGGVAGSIVRRGGEEIQRESDAWVREHGPVGFDEPAYTSAGSLPCRFVIHAVGPIWGEGDEEAKLAAAITGSLQLAELLECQSIAFPAISTGIFGYPKPESAKVILGTIRQYFSITPKSSLQVVRVTLLDRETLQCFLAAEQELSGSHLTNSSSRTGTR